MQVLVIEDEKRVAEFICKGLRVEGYFCEQANDGQTGLAMVKSQVFDVIILDRMLPDIDGINVLKQIRQQGIETPVLFLTALDDVEEKVHGLRSGGDDYLTKPFDFDELLARIDALARRASGKATDAEDSITLGDVIINLTHRSVHCEDQLIKLTALEYDLLIYLAKSRGRVLSRERILNAVWQLNSDPLTNVVDVYINRLRKKLDQDPQNSLIQTLRGVGYRLNSERN